MQVLGRGLEELQCVLVWCTLCFDVCCTVLINQEIDDVSASLLENKIARKAMHVTKLVAI